MNVEVIVFSSVMVGALIVFSALGHRMIFPPKVEEQWSKVKRNDWHV